MILISHRGNMNGYSGRENSHEQIELALTRGYECEIDVWYDSGIFWLGHDEPVEKTNEMFLKNVKLWCHAKNNVTLNALLNIKAHCYFHVNDACVLTSRSYIWTYPGSTLTTRSICVLQGIVLPSDIRIAAGVCSDFIDDIKDKLI